MLGVASPRTSFLFHVLFPAALASPTLAQTTPADTARFYKHHLGLVASPVLDHFFMANRSLPVGLLYKPSLSVNNVRSDSAFISNTIGSSASIGKEFTYRFSSHWTGATGADFSIGFSRISYNYKYQRLGVTNPYNPPTKVEEVDRYLYYQASVSPFVGLRFAIWPKVCASAESAVRLAYLRERIDSESRQ